LHACDTATDEALALALRAGADHIAVLPCCQAELAQPLKSNKPAADSPFSALTQHALPRREFASHLTNVLRALTLEAHAYQGTVAQGTGWVRSLDARRVLRRRADRERRPALAKLQGLLEQAGVKPALQRLLTTPADVAPVSGCAGHPLTRQVS